MRPTVADVETRGGLFRCSTCRREQPLGDAPETQDWPTCCGAVMLWVLSAVAPVQREAVS